MIEKDIREYARQFAYEPEVKNAERLGSFKKVVIGGMGGSGLVAGLLRAIKPEMDVVAHHEYGLPKFIDKNEEEYLFVAVSHSGETGEVIDFAQAAIARGLNTAVIAARGRLLALAQEKQLPYIDLPGDEVQPRMTLGYMLRAILKLVGEESLYKQTGRLANSLKSERYEKEGKKLARVLLDKIPVIYASRANQILAYNWKIKFNETAKVPAFYNTLPELSHNEIQGLATRPGNERILSERMHFIFLEDDADDQRVQTRMKAVADMYREWGLFVEHIKIEGQSRLERIFSALVLGDWAAYYTALGHRVEPEPVPAIDQLKKALGA